MTTEPELSVLVPAYNAGRHLAGCLAALQAQTLQPERFEVVVVDDGSQDDTSAICRRFGVRVITHERNRGAAAARNTAARAARSDLLVFIDSDLELSPHVCSLLVDAHRGPGPEEVRTGWYERVPANQGLFPSYKALWTWYCWDRTTAEDGACDHFQGALNVMHRSLFEGLGGFDESLAGGNVEDYELSQRMRARGVRIFLDRELTGRHHFPGYRETARRYFKRTRMWLRTRNAGAGFSSGQASAGSALLAGCAFMSAGGIASLPLFWLWPVTVPLTSAATLGFVAHAVPFARLCRRERGALFAAYAVAVNYSLGVVVCTGALTTPLGRRGAARGTT